MTKAELEEAYDEFMLHYPLQLKDLPGEVWQPIDDFIGYAISNYGRVKSFRRNRKLIMRPRLSGRHLRVQLYQGPRAQHQFIHLLVASAFVPNSLNQSSVFHKDGNIFNNYYENLGWKNEELPPIKSGFRSKSPIQSPDVIIYIRENPKSLSLKDMGQELGLDQSAISLIQRGLRWGDMPGPIRRAISPNRR